MIAAAKEGFETLATLRTYRSTALPVAHEELAAWGRVAAEIPDPELRRAATSALSEKAANVEATAVLATLAPLAHRATVVRSSAALQIAIDYLDVLGEEPAPNLLTDGLRLHLALGAALCPGAAPQDWYRDHPRREDGGYLDRLVARCQEGVAALPAGEVVLPLARRAAERCGEGQSYTHAAATGMAGDLESWSWNLQAPEEFSWWEVAAGACSSVAAHALIALAGDPEADAADAGAVDAAYFPAIGALTVILDDLVDRDQDLAAGEHSYLDYYDSAVNAAERLAPIAATARRSTGELRDARRHRAILTGVVAYYLASGRAALPAGARRKLARSTGPATRPLTTVLRLLR